MNMNMKINKFGGSMLKKVQIGRVHQKWLEILGLTIVTIHS